MRHATTIAGALMYLLIINEPSGEGREMPSSRSAISQSTFGVKGRRGEARAYGTIRLKEKGGKGREENWLVSQKVQSPH